MTSHYDSTRKVGTGSREHDLTDEVMTMRRTSVGVHGRKEGNVDDVLGTTPGMGRSVVAHRISSIFFEKYAANPSAV